MRDAPIISEDFDGLDFTVGEIPRDGTGFFVSPAFIPDEDRSEAAMPGVVDSLWVGVADLDPDFEATCIEDRAAGVEERLAAVFDGVEDLTIGAVFFIEGNVALGVGVEGREGFDFAGKVGRRVGVACLEVDFWFPDDKGLLFTAEEADFSAEFSGSLDFTVLSQSGNSV